MRLPAELHFVEPIAKWQLTDRERHHRLDEREAICCALFHRMQGLGFASMPDDPAHQLNRFECQADFSYEITVKTIKIRDTGKGTKAVTDDLEAVLRKIEGWHQGSISGFVISYLDATGSWHPVSWDGNEATVKAASSES